jgi:hypothetical protein
MSMHDFAATATRGGDVNFYLQVLLAWARGGEPERRSEMQHELDRIDWAWLRDACERAGAGGLEACQLWCSYGGLETPCHFDGSANFLAQLAGRKRVLLYSPRHYFHLFPCPVGHPMDNYSLVPDPELADARRFPAVRRARGIVATLQVGEVLWLPPFWWHHVSQPGVGEENISLNFWRAAQHHMPSHAESHAHGWHRIASPSSRCAGGRTLEQHEWLSMRGVGSPRRVTSFWVGDDAAAVAGELSALLAGEVPGLPVAEGSADDEEGIPAMESDAGAVRCVHAARMAEHAAVVVAGGVEAGGRLLTVLAAGADAEWPAASRARAFAARLRVALADVLEGDAAAVTSLLRAATRHGRLHPGLAPRFDEASVVSSERGDVTGVPLAKLGAPGREFKQSGREEKHRRSLPERVQVSGRTP